MIANAIPKAKAKPICKIPPNVETPMASPRPVVVESVNAVIAAIPGKT